MAHSISYPLTDMSPIGWVSFGVSNQERWDIECAAKLIGRTFADDRGAAFTVEKVADCRPSFTLGAAVRGTRVYPDGTTYQDAGAWIGELGAEIEQVTA